MENENQEKLLRHHLVDRLFHWIMAVSILTLLLTGFLPILGLKFSWVDPHWIAGLVFTAAILFHIVRAIGWQDFFSMVVRFRDLKNAWNATRWAIVQSGQEPEKPGKYPLLNKLYHHTVATMSIIVVATGLLMMIKIDTPWWERDPYFFEDWTWGVIYVLHDLSALFFITLVIIHIYFGLRPEKLWMTRAMILGWITRKEYIDHYDQDQWQAPELEIRTKVFSHGKIE
ncbi:MAG: cytochrome b/b6 domain-containing protein [Deltaproteobacteria bacterium]|jgi:formate dehydrogenase subunit gamma